MIVMLQEGQELKLLFPMNMGMQMIRSMALVFSLENLSVHAKSILLTIELLFIIP